MHTDGFDNYQKSLIRQTRYMDEADRHRLAQQYSSKYPGRSSSWTPCRQPGFIAVFILVCVLVLFSIAPSVLAHDSPGLERGQCSLFHDAMLAFTLGHYYYNAEQYDKALDYFEQSIDLLPEAVFEIAPQDYANVYRMLGKSQLELGQVNEAQASFERYLMLAGEGADLAIVALMTDPQL